MYGRAKIDFLQRVSLSESAVAPLPKHLNGGGTFDGSGPNPRCRQHNRNVEYDEARDLCTLFHFSDVSGAGGAGVIGAGVRSAADML
jgi:hypothetical protein